MNRHGAAFSSAMWRESALLAASMCLEFATAAACEGKTSCKYMNTVFVSPPFKPSLCSALLAPRMYGDISWTSVTLSSGWSRRRCRHAATPP